MIKAKQTLSTKQKACLNEFNQETGLNIIGVEDFERGECSWKYLWEMNLNSFWSIKCNVNALSSQASKL